MSKVPSMLVRRSSFLLLCSLACHPTSTPETPERSLPPPKADVVATLVEHGPPPATDPHAVATSKPSVARVGPDGAVDPRTNLFVHFTHPIQPVTDGSAAPRFEIDPPVAGTVRWVDPYRLSFDPEDVLPLATRFEVRVRGDLVTTVGEPMKLDTSFAFETQRPRIEIESAAYSWNEEDEHHWKSAFAILVDDSTKLSVAELRQHVHAVARPRDGSPEIDVPVVVRRPSQKERETFWRVQEEDFVVRPKRHWPADAEIEIIIDDELRLGGPLPTGQAVSRVITTEPGLEVKVQCTTQYEDGCDPGPLTLQLSNPIARKQLRNIEITPRPRKLKIDLYYGNEDVGDSVRINGRFQEGTSYTVRAKPGLQDIHGQPLVEPLSKTIDVVLPPPEVTLLGSHGTLPAEHQRTVGLETRWVKRARIRTAVLEDRQLLSQYLREPEELRIPNKPRKRTNEVVDLDITGDLGWASTVIDLAKLSGGERRPVMIEVQPIEMMPEAAHRPMPKTARAIYQQTDLGAVSMVSPSKTVTRVTSLETAEPVKGVQASLFRGTLRVPAVHMRDLGAADDGGLVELPRSTALPKRGLVLLQTKTDRFVAQIGELRDLHDYGYSRRWWWKSPYDDPRETLGELVTERPLYRPGDDVYVVGWSARSTNHTDTGLEAIRPRTPVELRLLDRDNEEVSRRVVATKGSGKYWAKLEVPDSAALGYYTVEAKLGDESFATGIRVKDFRTPTFSVDASAQVGDVVAGKSVDVAVSASYFFGGAVPIERLGRSLRCQRAWFRPPGVDQAWRFGSVPWGDLDGWAHGVSGAVELTPEVAKTGHTRLTFATDFVPAAAPYRCTLAVAVRDVSLEDVGGEAAWMVHPDAYVALRGPEETVRVGGTLSIPVRGYDFSGQRVAEAVEVNIERARWEETDDGWVTKREAAKHCTLTTTAEGKDATCDLRKLKEGRYEITAERAAGPSTRAKVSTTVWVGPHRKPRKSTKPEWLELDVVPNNPRPGEIVEVRVRAPEKTGRGVVVLMSGGVRKLLPFTLKDNEATLKVKADQSWVPRMELEALLPRPHTAKQLPDLQQATAEAEVREHGRDLKVEVDAPETASPNEEIEIALKVRNHVGDPTAANVSVWAVDEAILSLQEPEIPELVQTFLVDRGRRTSIEHDFTAMLDPYSKVEDPYVEGIGLGNIGTIGRGGGGGTGSGYGAGGLGLAGTSPARERFETTPIFIGDVKLPASGEGVVVGRMPENLTTFRITAIASAPLPGGKAPARFGHADDRTRNTVPLALRVLTPRVMRAGDEADLAAVVDNLAGPAGTLEVSLTLAGDAGALQTQGTTRHRVEIEAGGQVRLPFPVRASALGEGTVEMRAVLTPSRAGRPPLQDAMKVSVPVEQERTLVRRSAVYGSLTTDDPVAISVVAPKDRRVGSGRVEVRLDASMLEGLQDVAGDLVDYPYGCVEQTSSGLIPLVALGELARQYPLGIDDVDGYIASGIARLRRMQTDTGGFGYWPGAQTPHLYGTAYATWVLERAREAGYRVPEKLRTDAHAYLEQEVQRWTRRKAVGAHDAVPITMALHALAVADKAPRDAVDRVYDLSETLPAFSRALLLLAMHAIDPADARVEALVDGLEAEIETSAGGATVRDGGAIFPQYFDTSTRTSAMVLLALLTARPDHPQVEPLARNLTSLRAGGRLWNTQENAYAMLGLAGYARSREAVVPRLTAHAWIGPEHTLTREIQGTRLASATADASLADLLQAPTPEVTLGRVGEGRLYYRVGMTWTPEKEQDRAVAAGIAVETKLRDGDGRVVEGDAIAPGTLLALDVTLTVDQRVDYIAVDMPLPAGLEGIDTSIGKGRRAMVVGGKRAWWASHEEIRRDRALLFADQLGPGSHTHTIYLRAATPGTFEMPPTVAQSMYFPEISGHTARRQVVIEPLPGG